MRKVRKVLRSLFRFAEQIYVIRKLEKLGVKNNLTKAELMKLILKKEGVIDETK